MIFTGRTKLNNTFNHSSNYSYSRNNFGSLLCSRYFRLTSNRNFKVLSTFHPDLLGNKFIVDKKQN